MPYFRPKHVIQNLIRYLLSISRPVQPGIPSTETAFIWWFPKLAADKIILNFHFRITMNHLQLDLLSTVLFFSSLRVIVSEFYDLDVGTVKKIEIKPKRIINHYFGEGTWTLKEVQRCNL